jgi:hypothetical protein
VTLGLTLKATERLLRSLEERRVFEGRPVCEERDEGVVFEGWLMFEGRPASEVEMELEAR